MNTNTPNFMPHHKGIGKQLGYFSKKASPMLSNFFLKFNSDKVFRYILMYLEFLQGKGSGKGWDINSEIKTACFYIRRDNPIIFDIGAHRGLWSKGIIDRFGTNCHIYQFEPAKQNINDLKKMHSSNITLIEKALSNEEGIADFYSTKLASDTSSLYKRRESIHKRNNYEIEKVELTTIDKVVDEFNIETIDFIKMDIEGHELAAI